MRTLNLGILAHVDAGKTTLTERLLFRAGAIDHVGSVDAGTTQTDSLDLERERGITIRSAVASFLVGDLAVNLVDTPGHPDFIAEVERVLGVLDGAILVVSAVEDVQPQTPLLFRALQRLQVPTLIFVNKIDRAGADPERVVATMGRRLSPAVVPMGVVRDPGRREASVVSFAPDDGAHRTRLTEILAEHDEAILGSFVRDEAGLSPARLRDQLGEQTRQGWVNPVYFGSAAMGVGIDALLAGIDELLSGSREDSDDEGAEVSGRVFKIERTPAGERVAYVRLFTGTLRPRQRVRVGGGEEAKPTSIKVFAPSGAPRRDALTAGEMAAVRGLGAVRVGDAIGAPPPGQEETARFPRPALEAVVFPLRPEQSGSLRAALAQLAEQDPLIDVRQDEHRHEIAVSLYGEVQKEVIQATLERDYGIAADFRETTTVCIERPARVGEAEEVIQAKTKTNITGRSSPLSTNPFKATLGPPDRAGPRRVRDRVPERGRGAVRPAVHLQHGRGLRDTDGGLCPRGTARRAGRLAGDRLPGHDDRLRLRVAGHVLGRLPAPDAARARNRARSCRDVGVRAALPTCARDAIRDGPGCPWRSRPTRRPRDGPVLGERPDEGECSPARGPRPLAAAPAAGAVDGGGDPRGAPWRLPTDRQRSAESPAHEPQPARPRRLARIIGEAHECVPTL